MRKQLSVRGNNRECEMREQNYQAAELVWMWTKGKANSGDQCILAKNYMIERLCQNIN